MNETPSEESTIQSEKTETISWKTLIVIFTGSALTAAAILFPLLYWLLKPDPVSQSYYVEGNPQGVRQLSEPRDLIDFTLASTTGEDMSLSDFQGETVLLYFGYTFCPDVCQLTLTDLKRTHESLGEYADNVRIVFVSVDPARDTPERMLSLFDVYDVTDYTVGLQGDDVILERIGVDYSLYYERHDNEGEEQYLVDHTASIYLITPDGQLDTIFAYGTLPDIMVEHIIARTGN